MSSSESSSSFDGSFGSETESDSTDSTESTDSTTSDDDLNSDFGSEYAESVETDDVNLPIAAPVGTVAAPTVAREIPLLKLPLSIINSPTLGKYLNDITYKKLEQNIRFQKIRTLFQAERLPFFLITHHLYLPIRILFLWLHPLLIGYADSGFHINDVRRIGRHRGNYLIHNIMAIGKFIAELNYSIECEKFLLQTTVENIQSNPKRLVKLLTNFDKRKGKYESVSPSNNYKNLEVCDGSSSYYSSMQAYHQMIDTYRDAIVNLSKLTFLQKKNKNNFVNQVVYDDDVQRRPLSRSCDNALILYVQRFTNYFVRKYNEMNPEHRISFVPFEYVPPPPGERYPMLSVLNEPDPMNRMDSLGHQNEYQIEKYIWKIGKRLRRAHRRTKKTSNTFTPALNSFLHYELAASSDAIKRSIHADLLQEIIDANTDTSQVLSMEKDGIVFHIESDVIYPWN